MFCKKCGNNIPDGSSVCPNCGAEIKTAVDNVDSKANSVNANKSVFYKSKEGKLITGVCAGLGKKFGMNPWLFRVIFIVSGFIPFLGWALLGFYIVGAIVWKFDDEIA